MNNFVNYGPPSMGPPVQCEDSVLYAFFLEADKPKLAALCNKVFTAPSGSAVTCQPLDKYVLITFGSMAWLGNLSIGIALGVRENQVFIQIPVSFTLGANAAPTIGFFSPYSWVDNSISLTGGREVFGFGKNYGELVLPANDDPRYLILNAFCGNVADEIMQVQPMITVVRKNPNPAAMAAAQANLLPAMLAFFQQWLAGAAAPQIFLKQFRDVKNGQQACFQQIVGANYTVKLKPLTGAIGLPNDYDFSIVPFDTHPIVPELGIINPQTVHGGFRLEADLVTLDAGEILWTAP